MARTIAAVFPERGMAERAMDTLKAAGFAPEFAGNGQGGDGMSTGQRGCIVVVEPQAREADLRDLLMHAGASSLQGQGTDGPGHTISPTTEEDQPIPVRDGERLAPGGPEAQATAAAYSALDHGGEGAKQAEDLKVPPAVRRASIHSEAVDEVHRTMGGGTR